MDERERKIIKIIEKHGKIHVSHIIKLAGIKRPTVLKILKELYENRKVTFVNKQNRKYYFIMKKGYQNFDELEKNKDVELDILELQVNEAIDKFKKDPNDFSLETLVELGIMIIQWFGILKVYMHEMDKKDIPNRWFDIELRLNKIYSKLIQKEPVLLKRELLRTLTIAITIVEVGVKDTLKKQILQKRVKKHLE